MTDPPTRPRPYPARKEKYNRENKGKKQAHNKTKAVASGEREAGPRERRVSDVVAVKSPVLRVFFLLSRLTDAGSAWNEVRHA